MHTGLFFVHFATMANSLSAEPWNSCFSCSSSMYDNRTWKFSDTVLCSCNSIHWKEYVKGSAETQPRSLGGLFQDFLLNPFFLQWRLSLPKGTHSCVCNRVSTRKYVYWNYMAIENEKMCPFSIGCVPVLCYLVCAWYLIMWVFYTTVCLHSVLNSSKC